MPFIGKEKWRIPYGIVANVLDCDIIGSEFKHQSCNYIYFQINTLRKSMNFLIPKK